jgi:DNA-directed RNA polymerase subunit RPC12/RpoP
MTTKLVKIVLDGYVCQRCGHQWVPRKAEQPRVCPKCKTYLWDRPRKDYPAKYATCPECKQNVQQMHDGHLLRHFDPHSRPRQWCDLVVRTTPRVMPRKEQP